MLNETIKQQLLMKNEKINEQPLVTVIVPIYNSERNLEKCVNSIMNQTYSKLEILLVNDGSIDESLAICKKCSSKDFRVRIIEQLNQGVSAARNKGMKEATGEIYIFVDADDWIEKNYIEKIMNSLKNNDGVFCGYTKEIGKQKLECTVQPGIMDLENINDTQIVPFFMNGFIHPCWNKCFRADIIKKYSLCFDTEVHISEDSLFCLEYLLHCNAILILNNVGYHYCIREDELSLSKKTYSNIFEIYERVYYKLEQVLQRGNCGKDLKQEILDKTLFPQIYNSVIKVINSTNKNAEEKRMILDKASSIEYYRKILDRTLDSSNNRIEKFIVKLIMKRHYFLLEIIWKILIRKK